MGLSISGPVSGTTMIPVEVDEMDDADLKLYFFASLLATPTNTGSSSSVLSSTRTISTSFSFPLPFPFAFPFSNVAFFAALGFTGGAARPETFRGIRWGLRDVAVVSMIWASSEEVCWSLGGVGRDGPASDSSIFGNFGRGHWICTPSGCFEGANDRE